MIQSLTEFSCVPEFKRKETTFRVHARGQSSPVAVVRKDGVTDSRRPYSVFEGPQLDQRIGWVNSFQAMNAERKMVGEISCQYREYVADELSISLTGMSSLDARSEGVQTRLTRSFPMHFVLRNIQAFSYVLGVRLRFSAPSCKGFSVARKLGMKSRYTVKIHDPGVDRLLPLMCVIHIAENISGDMRQGFANITSNPFKD